MPDMEQNDNTHFARKHLEQRLKDHNEALTFALKYYDARKKTEPDSEKYLEKLKKRAIKHHRQQIEAIQNKLNGL